MSISKGVALVTGAAQGIGRSIALRLALDGFNIALNDVPQKGPELKDLATEIESLKSQVCVVPADVSIDEPVKEMVDSTVSKLGGLDVVSSIILSHQTSPEFLCTDGCECWSDRRDFFVCILYDLGQADR